MILVRRRVDLNRGERYIRCRCATDAGLHLNAERALAAVAETVASTSGHTKPLACQEHVV